MLSWLLRGSTLKSEDNGNRDMLKGMFESAEKAPENSSEREALVEKIVDWAESNPNSIPKHETSSSFNQYPALNLMRSAVLLLESGSPKRNELAWRIMDFVQKGESVPDQKAYQMYKVAKLFQNNDSGYLTKAISRIIDYISNQEDSTQRFNYILRKAVCLIPDESDNKIDILKRALTYISDTTVEPIEALDRMSGVISHRSLQQKVILAQFILEYVLEKNVSPSEEIVSRLAGIFKYTPLESSEEILDIHRRIFSYVGGSSVDPRVKIKWADIASKNTSDTVFKEAWERVKDELFTAATDSLVDAFFNASDAPTSDAPKRHAIHNEAPIPPSQG